ncbi:hypothetical protein ABPG72_009386 [Tetrahymena utriculariae]
MRSQKIKQILLIQLQKQFERSSPQNQKFVVYNLQELKISQQILKFIAGDANESAFNFFLKRHLLIPPTYCNQQLIIQKDTRYCNDIIWRCLYQDLWIFKSLRLSLDPSRDQQQDFNKDKGIVLESNFFYYINNWSSQELLGADEKVFEIDDNRYRRIYNRGRYSSQQLIVGICETKGEIFDWSIFLKFPNTLIPLIELFVSKRALLVITDRWIEYSNLKKKAFTRLPLIIVIVLLKQINIQAKETDKVVSPKLQNNIDKNQEFILKSLFKYYFKQNTNLNGVNKMHLEYGVNKYHFSFGVQKLQIKRWCELYSLGNKCEQLKIDFKCEYFNKGDRCEQNADCPLQLSKLYMLALECLLQIK